MTLLSSLTKLKACLNIVSVIEAGYTVKRSAHLPYTLIQSVSVFMPQRPLYQRALHSVQILSALAQYPFLPGSVYTIITSVNSDNLCATSVEIPSSVIR